MGVYADVGTDLIRQTTTLQYDAYTPFLQCKYPGLGRWWGGRSFLVICLDLPWIWYCYDVVGRDGFDVSEHPPSLARV
jgi:hypothetical protein